MKVIQLICVMIVIILNFSQIESKTFSTCELVNDLNKLYEVPRESIYKHLCIFGENLYTNRASEKFFGIYRIGSQWWCGKDDPDGKCDAKCSDFLDDDIADDVACASKILRDLGKLF